MTGVARRFALIRYHCIDNGVSCCCIILARYVFDLHIKQMMQTRMHWRTVHVGHLLCNKSTVINAAAYGGSAATCWALLDDGKLVVYQLTHTVLPPLKIASLIHDMADAFSHFFSVKCCNHPPSIQWFKRQATYAMNANVLTCSDNFKQEIFDKGCWQE